MTSYTKLTRPRDLAETESDAPAAPVVNPGHPVHREGAGVSATPGDQRCTFSVEMRVGEAPPAKVAKVANPGGGTASALHAVDVAPLLKFAKVANRGERAAGVVLPTRPLTAGFPCVICGGNERWDDAGVWRCGACWPTPLTQKTRAAERAYQRAGRTPRTARKEPCLHEHMNNLHVCNDCGEVLDGEGA
jgi:hypothetical protein